MGRSSVDATKARRIRIARAEGRRLRRVLVVRLDRDLLLPVFLAADFFELADEVLLLWVVRLADLLESSEEFEDCPATSDASNKAPSMPAARRGSTGTIDNDQKDLMISL
jgi:hypothetical protein